MRSLAGAVVMGVAISLSVSCGGGKSASAPSSPAPGPAGVPPGACAPAAPGPAPGGAAVISTLAGTGSDTPLGDGGPATKAGLQAPEGVAVDAAGTVYVADTDHGAVRKVDRSGGITTFAGGGESDADGVPATSARLEPKGIAVDCAGNLYVGSSDNKVHKVTPGGTITTVAGNGTQGFSGDGGRATRAELQNPVSFALDPAGNLYIADLGNGRVRKVDPKGAISTVAGAGDNGSTEDGGAATKAVLSYPDGVALDPAGNLYITDHNGGKVRKVDRNGVITTVAGFGSDDPGDGGPAIAADIRPDSVAVDRDGSLVVADSSHHRIRKIDRSGVITTIAGSGGEGFSGDGGPANKAELNGPLQIALDGTGNLYIADRVNNRIRKVAGTG